MGRPSNPKLMARVLEAVTHLAEGKGSLTRDVLDFVKQNSSGSKRNLTMQVRRALKHAVNAGLLRCKSGRYKMQLALNPISHHQHHNREGNEGYKNADVLEDMKTEPPVGGTDTSRRVQDRRKPSRKKRAARKSRKRSAGRGTKRKVTKRRTGTMEKRGRKVSKRSRRKIGNDEVDEDWPTRRRRMMSKPRFDDEPDDDDEEEEEEEGEEDEDEDEDGDEEEDEDYPRDRRDSPKMKSVNEDSASNMSGDSNSVGRHRSRRSKHLANDRRSPSKRGNGDGEGRKKPSRRSTSRRRSQPRQRENRRDSGAEEADEAPETMDDEPDNEGVEMDEDQGDVDQNGGPPENQGNE